MDSREVAGRYAYTVAWWYAGHIHAAATLHRAGLAHDVTACKLPH